MPLETGTYINDLDAANPLNSDIVGQGDDHLRLLKGTIKTTFPNMGGINGFSTKQDAAVSISSTWNTRRFVVSNSATATVVLTLPPAASITAGFQVEFLTLAGAAVSLLPSGAATVNGAASVAIGPQLQARAIYRGTSAWDVVTVPSGISGYRFDQKVEASAGLSVSGAFVAGGLAVFNGLLSGSSANFSGAVSISGAVNLVGTLVSGGLAVFNGLLSGSSANFSGAMSISGATTIVGALHVDGGCTFSSSVVINNGLGVVGASTFNGTVTISGTLALPLGQIAFPATQNASSGANVLDDYEEGTWTPSFLPATAGTASYSYTTQLGSYTKIGRSVLCTLNVNFGGGSTGTGTGNLQIQGLPFSGNAAQSQAINNWSGLTLPAPRQALSLLVTTSTNSTLQCAGTGTTAATLTVANTTFTFPIVISGNFHYDT